MSKLSLHDTYEFKTLAAFRHGRDPAKALLVRLIDLVDNDRDNYYQCASCWQPAAYRCNDADLLLCCVCVTTWSRYSGKRFREIQDEIADGVYSDADWHHVAEDHAWDISHDVEPLETLDVVGLRNEALYLLTGYGSQIVFRLPWENPPSHWFEIARRIKTPKRPWPSRSRAR